MEKMKMHTPDITESNIEKIGQLFPNCLTERIGEDGKVERVIDFDQLRQELSKEIVEGPQERYQFTWPDKKKAIRLANAPSTLTLRPIRNSEDSPSGFDSNGEGYMSSGSVDFDNTGNLYIEGDNLEVLKLLREDYLGKVKMIYIDPPYNTGNDFVYDDDFVQSSAVYTSISGQKDSAGNIIVQNTESNGRFHTDWLNMMYPRLKIARDILKEDGVLFVSIDDNEVDNLQKICNEVFGEINFIANLIWKSKSGGANDSRYFAVDHEYILVYAKNASKFTINLDLEATVTTSYNRKDEKGEYALDRLDKQSIRYSPALDYDIIGPDGRIYKPQHKDPAHPNATWRWSKDHVESNYEELVFENGCVYTKNYKKAGAIARSLLLEDRFGRTRTGKTDCFALFNRDYFSNPKPFKLIRYLAMIATDKDSIVLDFFSGSGTTAQSVMQLNAEDGGKRKFILVQLPEVTEDKTEAAKAGYSNICEIGKERIRRAGKTILDEQEKTESAGGFFAQTDSKPKVDVGFRVLKLDSSNMEDVYYRPEESSESTLFESNVKEGRTSEDLLFQVMLECNLPLSAKIQTEKIAGKDVFTVNNGYLIACFDEDVNEEVIKAVAKRKPYYFVMRDSSLASDNVADNFEQIFQAYSKDTIRRML